MTVNEHTKHIRNIYKTYTKRYISPKSLSYCSPIKNYTSVKVNLRQLEERLNMIQVGKTKLGSVYVLYVSKLTVFLLAYFSFRNWAKHLNLLCKMFNNDLTSLFRGIHI